MTTPYIRDLVCETILWCETNMGKKKKRLPLTYKVLTQKKGEEYFGMYDPTINSIIIFRNRCETVRETLKCVIHEYTHYLQDLRGYSRVLREVGYRRHPQEIEARENEKLFSKCWTDIKNKLC